MNETIRGLIATTINRLANAGYSEIIVETYQAVYNGLVRFCETDGVKAYTTEVGECFWNHFQKENPNMSRDRVSAYRSETLGFVSQFCRCLRRLTILMFYSACMESYLVRVLREQNHSQRFSKSLRNMYTHISLTRSMSIQIFCFEIMPD